MSPPIRPLNYRHAFHAGNFADVVKHAALVALLQALKTKPKPLCYFDSHAGRGRYRLDAAAATATCEATDGIARLLATPELPPALKPYVDLVRALGAGDGSMYPGSPMIAAALLGGDDRALLCELATDEAAALRALFRDDPRVHVHRRDGYEALAALLPPAEKRGLVLIDPPFEAREAEFREIGAALDAALTRWPTGCYAVWYPIKLASALDPFHRWLRERRLAKALTADFFIHPGNTALRLNGCGLAIINPPWRFETRLATILDALLPLLGGAAASRRINWSGTDG